MKDFRAFKTSAESSSELKERPINLLSYAVSKPIVRLNSRNTLPESEAHDFDARDLSNRKSLYAPSPTFTTFFLVKDTQDGSVSFKVSVFLITGSPFSILQMAEFVVPRSIPYLILTCAISCYVLNILTYSYLRRLNHNSFVINLWFSYASNFLRTFR